MADFLGLQNLDLSRVETNHVVPMSSKSKPIGSNKPIKV